MNTFDDLTDQTFHSVIGRKVVDSRGEDIGTLEALWTDEETGKVEFIGVKTGWIFGKTHVVPARGVEIRDDQDQIRVPYEAQFVKDAPSYPAHEELTDAQEREIYQYYGVTGAGAVGHGLHLTEETGLAAGAAGTTAGTRAGLTRAEERDEALAGESVENPVVERGPAGAREPIGETTVTGARADALPGDRDIAEARRRATGTPEEAQITTEEERLRVGTRDVVAGRVRLRKVVRTEQASVPVELRQEDVVVERVPADQVRPGDRTDVPGEVEVELRRQEPVVEKERVVTGAVRVRKTEEVQRQTVSDSVRKEDVEVDRSAQDRPGGVAATTTGETAAAEAERERERERERRDPGL